MGLIEELSKHLAKLVQKTVYSFQKPFQTILTYLLFLNRQKLARRMMIHLLQWYWKRFEFCTKI